MGAEESALKIALKKGAPGPSPVVVRASTPAHALIPGSIFIFSGCRKAACKTAVALWLPRDSHKPEIEPNFTLRELFGAFAKTRNIFFECLPQIEGRLGVGFVQDVINSPLAALGHKRDLELAQIVLRAALRRG
jgi:hypothetical protein